MLARVEEVPFTGVHALESLATHAGMERPSDSLKLWQALSLWWSVRMCVIVAPFQQMAQW